MGEKRRRWSREDAHEIFEKRKRGYLFQDIGDLLELSDTTCENIVRAGEALKAHNVEKALASLLINKAKKLTGYSFSRIDWICDELKIKRPTEDEIREVWNKLRSDELKLTHYEELLKRSSSTKNEIPDQLRLEMNPQTAERLTLETVRDKLNAEPIANVIDYINSRIVELYA